MILKPVANIIPRNMTRLNYLTFIAGLYRAVVVTYLVMKPIEKPDKSLIVLITENSWTLRRLDIGLGEALNSLSCSY